MNKSRYERLNRVAGSYKVLFGENKIQNLITGRKNGRLSSNGRYIAVNIQDKGKSYTYSLHEIIAFKYYDNLVGNEVNHKDGNRFNNLPSNIEVVTPIENKKHQQKNLLLAHVDGSKNGSAKLNKKAVKRIRELYSTTKNYTQTGKMFDIGRNTVKDIVMRTTWRHVI